MSWETLTRVSEGWTGRFGEADVAAEERERMVGARN